MGCGSLFLYLLGFAFSALHLGIGKFLFSSLNHPSEVSEPSLVAKQFQLPRPRREPWLWSTPLGMEVLETAGLSDQDGAEIPVGF